MEADYAARIRLAANRVWWTSLDLVFPPRCANCQRAGERLCALCRSQIEYLADPICQYCGYPLDDTPTTGECSQCRRTLFPGNGLRSLAFHSGPLRKAIHAFKYRNSTPLSEILAGLMARRWPAGLPSDAILMPVPLSSDRRRERGFNQAEVLARQLGGYRRIPISIGGLQRVRSTPSQVGLNGAQRRQNVVGAFSADPFQVKNLELILIDDVCTTGATLGACADVLLQAGAAQVWAYTLTRARYEDDDKLP